MAKKRSKSKSKFKRTRTKHLTTKDVDKIGKNSFLKIKYPSKAIYELAARPRHERMSHGLKEFMYGVIFGFILALIFMRILRMI